MANTLFDHGAEYHFHSNVNFPQNHAGMRQTDHERTKPSKLELLREDYRSKLLHEKEQKANALFEQKVRADLLPKQGSVREFFLSRRIMASTTARSGASIGGNLPPINTRYKGKRKDKTKIVEKQLRDKRKEKADAIAFLKAMEKEDSSVGELERLREIYRKSKDESQHGVLATSTAKNSFSPTFTSTGHPRIVSKDCTRTSLKIARGVKSREVYKRGGKPTHEGKKERNINSVELESSFTENNNSKVRGVKSREVYKRGRKPSHEDNKANTTKNTNTHSEELTSSHCENEVSKSLVQIKELVQRRKTEELILCSRMTKFTTEDDPPSPRRNSQSFDEMCKAEIELRETISRDQKRLLALQERRRRKSLENRDQFEQENRERQSQSIETKRNDVRQRKGRTTNMNKSESWEEISGGQTRSNEKERKQNTQYETTDMIVTKTKNISERNVNQQQQQIKKAQTTQGTESKLNEGNYSADVMTDLVTCSNCGRGFMKERIEKHQNACRKASSRVKKPFDARRKRAEGTDMEKYIIMGREVSDDYEYKGKKRSWRKTHENFIQSIRSARRQEPQSVTPLSNPDYIECSYCQRKFKPAVAERHIPKCKDTRARPRPPRR